MSRSQQHAWSRLLSDLQSETAACLGSGGQGTVPLAPRRLAPLGQSLMPLGAAVLAFRTARRSLGGEGQPHSLDQQTEARRGVGGLGGTAGQAEAELDELAGAAAPGSVLHGARMPTAGRGLAPWPMGAPPSDSKAARGPRTLPQKPFGSKADDLSTFFPNTPFLPLPKSQCLWVPSLRRGQGRPEGPGRGLPPRGCCPPPPLPSHRSGLFGGDIRQGNHK